MKEKTMTNAAYKAPECVLLQLCSAQTIMNWSGNFEEVNVNDEEEEW